MEVIPVRRLGDLRAVPPELVRGHTDGIGTRSPAERDLRCSYDGGLWRAGLAGCQGVGRACRRLLRVRRGADVASRVLRLDGVRVSRCGREPGVAVARSCHGPDLRSVAIDAV